MKEIILHVGLEKTGTTYLQNVFSLNKEKLAHAGILYPKAGLEDRHHYWIAKALGFNFEHEKFDRSRLVVVREEIIKELSDTECQRILISSEHFDFNVSKEACNQVKTFFSGFNVNVVIFLRNQIDYAQSLYIEHVKWGGEQTFKEFLDTCGKFNFREKVGIWKEAGFDVKVVDYDRCDNDILSCFLSAADIDIGRESFELPALRKNVSPSIDFIELVRQLNIATDKELRRSRYASLCEELEKKGGRLDAVFSKRAWGFPTSAWPIVEAWERENQQLAMSLGIDPLFFLGGSVIDRFNQLKNYAAPNLSAFLLSGFPARLLKYPPKSPLWKLW